MSGFANVHTAWVDGDLYFYDKDGNEICHFDGTNRKLVIPSGSTFSCASLNLDTTELGLLDGATAGSLTASKVATRTAAQGIPLATAVVAAVGSVQGDGAALTKDVNLITGADNTTCVVLPAAVVGEVIRVVNTVANKTLPVFPATGGNINGLGANAAFTMGPARSATFVCTATNVWYVEPLAAATPTVANLDAIPTATGTGAEIDAQTKDVQSSASTVPLSASAAIQTCTITLKDADGNTVAAVQRIRVFLSTDAAGTTLASAANGTVAPTTGTILKEVSAKVDWDLLTSSGGVAVLSIDNTGGADHYAVYVNVVLPNGKLKTSLVTDVRAA